MGSGMERAGLPRGVPREARNGKRPRRRPLSPRPPNLRAAPVRSALSPGGRRLRLRRRSREEKQGGEAGGRREGMGTAGKPRRAPVWPPRAAAPRGEQSAGRGRGPRAGACGGKRRGPARGLDPGSIHAPLERNCGSSLGCWRLLAAGASREGKRGCDTPPTGQDRPAPQKLQCERRAAGSRFRTVGCREREERTALEPKLPFT